MVVDDGGGGDGDGDGDGGSGGDGRGVGEVVGSVVCDGCAVNGTSRTCRSCIPNAPVSARENNAATPATVAALLLTGSSPSPPYR